MTKIQRLIVYSIAGLIMGGFGCGGCSSSNGDSSSTQLPAELQAADFQVSSLSGTAPFHVTFEISDISSINNLVSAYRWDFGDGQSYAGTNPAHTYQDPGEYVVGLTIIDNFGNEVAFSKKINALPNTFVLPSTPPAQIAKIGIYAPCDFYVTDVALDAVGNVYATDWFYRTVSKYAPDGTLLLKIHDPSRLGKPRRLTVDASGRIYVTDPVFNLIHVYDSNGNEIDQWYIENLTTGGIKFAAPDRILLSLNTMDEIWVLDLSGNLISRIGSTGDGPGEFRGVFDAVVSPDNGLIAVDNGNKRIQKLDWEGNQVWSTELSGDFNLEFGVAVAVDSSGYIYVSDRRAYSILKFDPDGNYMTAWGSKGHEGGQFLEHNGIAISADDTLWVAGYHGHDIQQFDPQGALITRWQGHISGPGEFGYIAGVALSNGKLFAVDQVNQNVQVFDLQSQSFLYQFGERGEDLGTVFNFPRSIDVGFNGDLFIAGDRIVRQIKQDGSFVRLFRGGYAPVSAIMGLELTSSQCLFQAMTNNNSIIKRDISSGEILMRWEFAGSTPGKFTKPHGIAMGPDGAIYVTDAYQRVQKFHHNGQFIEEWPTVNGDSEVRDSYGLAIDQDNGIVYVGSLMEILAYDIHGNFLFSWEPQNPDQRGPFRHLALGQSGEVIGSDYRGTAYYFNY